MAGERQPVPQDVDSQETHDISTNGRAEVDVLSVVPEVLRPYLGGREKL